MRSRLQFSTICFSFSEWQPLSAPCTSFSTACGMGRGARWKGGEQGPGTWLRVGTPGFIGTEASAPQVEAPPHRAAPPDRVSQPRWTGRGPAHHSLAEPCYVKVAAHLSLSFLICKMVTLTVATTQRNLDELAWGKALTAGGRHGHWAPGTRDQLDLGGGSPCWVPALSDHKAGPASVSPRGQ